MQADAGYLAPVPVATAFRKGILRGGVPYTLLEMPVRRSQLMIQLEQVGPSGHALAMNLLGNADDAADVLQDAVATVLRVRSFDASKGTFKAWFLAVVRNRCIDVLRRRRPDIGIESVDAAAEEDEGPEAVATKDEMTRLVKREMTRLPRDHREILILRELLDLSYAEIGHVLGVPNGTVMSRLHRARSALADRVRAYG